MSDDIKVSVLTPIYNHKIEYVRQCLESLHAQTMQDIEFILIDNGATKESKDLISEYEQSDSRFRVIHLKENQGYGGAMNAGLDVARGEYIGIVESDDWVEPEMFAELYEMAFKNSADLVKSQYYEQNEDNQKLISRFPSDKMNKIIKNTEVPNFLLAHAAPWTILYRKAFLDKYCIRICERRGNTANDIGLVIKAFIAANKIFITDKAYYHYNVANTNSSMKIKNADYILNGLYAEYENIAAWFKKNINLCLDELFALVDKRKFFNFVCILKNKNIICSRNNLKLISRELSKIKYLKYFTDEDKVLLAKLKKNSGKYYRQVHKENSFIENIFSIKNNDRKTHKKITILGIKFSVKRNQKENVKQKENFEERLRSVLREEVSNVVAREVSLALSVQKLHMQTFPPFKNIHNNQSVAIIGCGPSIKYYNGQLNTVNIALNKAIFLDNINFDYLFTWDYLGFQEKAPDFFDRVKKYNCKKFYGKFLADNLSSIPEFSDDEENNIYHFYSSARHKLPAYSYGEIIHYDIETHPLADFMSISFGALHFALYTRPEKIYLIGLDTQNCGHYAGDNNTYNINKMMLGYRKFKTHIETHYPDVEIISVNPVGLKGLFKDVYTKEYVEAHPELFDSLEDIEILDNSLEKEFCRL